MDATDQPEGLQNRYPYSKTDQLRLRCLYTVHADNIALEEYQHSIILRQHKEKITGNKDRYSKIVVVIRLLW
jgi:hypothetical protein